MKFCDINNIKISPRLGNLRNKQSILRKFVFVTALLLPFIHYGKLIPLFSVFSNQNCALNPNQVCMKHFAIQTECCDFLHKFKLIKVVIT